MFVSSSLSTGAQLLYDAVLVSAAQQSEAAMCAHISPLCHHRALMEFPVLKSRRSLIFYLIRGCVGVCV